MMENQVGRSMMEMLGVLSIIGVLSVGGFGMVKKMQNSYDTNKVMEEISALSRKARVFAREDSLSNLKSSLPDGVSESGTNYIGTANIQYAFTQGGSTDKFLFTMTVSGLPEEICMQVVTADWGNKATTGFMALRRVSGPNLGTPYTSSLSLGDATTVCDGNSISLIMYYK